MMKFSVYFGGGGEKEIYEFSERLAHASEYFDFDRSPKSINIANTKRALCARVICP